MSNRVNEFNSYKLHVKRLMTALSVCVIVSYAKEKKSGPEVPPDYNSVVQVFVQPLKPIASMPWQD